MARQKGGSSESWERAWGSSLRCLLWMLRSVACPTTVTAAPPLLRVPLSRQRATLPRAVLGLHNLFSLVQRKRVKTRRRWSEGGTSRKKTPGTDNKQRHITNQSPICKYLLFERNTRQVPYHLTLANDGATMTDMPGFAARCQVPGSQGSTARATTFATPDPRLPTPNHLSPTLPAANRWLYRLRQAASPPRAGSQRQCNMGNESSRPDLSDGGRSRSLSPLPRDERYRHEDEDREQGGSGDNDNDALTRIPSTMPATLTSASARRRPSSPASPRRRRRTRAPSPESPLHTLRSASSPRHAPSRNEVGRSATQPDPADTSASRSSKKKSKDKRERKAKYSTHAEDLESIDEFRARIRRSKAPSPFPESDPDEPTDDPELEAVHASQAQSPKQTKLRKTPKGKGREPVSEATPDEALPAPSRPALDSDDDGPPPSAQTRGKRGRGDSDPGARGGEQLPRPKRPSTNGKHVAELSGAPHGEAQRDDINNSGFGPGDDMQVDSDNEVEPSRTTPSRSPVREDEPGTGSHVPSPASAPRPRNGDEANSDHADEGAPVLHAASPTPTAAEPAAQTPDTRRRPKRTVKRPFRLQEEQNTKAFAELPLNDAASLDPPGDAQSSAPAVATKPARTSRASRKKPDKRPAAGVDAEGLNDENSAGKSQYRSGPLSRAEQNQITRAVDRVRDAEGLSQEDMNRVIHENPRNSDQAINRQLWTSIQDACPSRPRKKLMSWTRQRFHNFAGRGTWTPAQDDELVFLIEKHGKKWSHIAGLINRYQKDVRDRWRNYLVCRHTVKTDAWSKDEEARFRGLVETSINQIRQGLNGNSSRKAPEALINWLQISEAMNHTRSRLQCMEKWKRMRAAEPLPDEVPTVLPQGNSRSLNKSRRDLRKLNAGAKYMLICAVRDSAVATDAEINWTNIVDFTFDGRYERQALVVAWGRLRQAVPDWERKTTHDCTLYLCEMFEREADFGREEPVDNPVSSDPKRGRKGKAGADRPSSSHPAPSTLQQQTVATDHPASGEPRRKRQGTQRKSGVAAAAAAAHTGGQAEPQGIDTGTEDQTGPEPRISSSRGALGQAEKEQSPELGSARPVPQSPPSAEADPPRAAARRERRASVGTKAAAGFQEQEEAVLPRPPRQSGATVLGKRWPPGDFTHGGDMGDARSKKRRTPNNTQHASGTKSNLDASGAQSPKMSSKSWSVISSDMDDMEDIPATLTRRHR